MSRTLMWHHQHEGRVVSGDEAATIAQRSIEAGSLDVELHHREGGVLKLVTNGDRAMLIRWWLTGEDEGVAAVDPSAGQGRRSGYVLANGQIDTYPDVETVPLAAAISAIRHIIDTDELDPGLAWRAW